MNDVAHLVTQLTRDLVAIDSRTFVSNVAVAERVERELSDFEVERVDFVDENRVAKRALVAHRGPKGGLALSGHTDTVPETGWQENPWSPRIEDGRLYGLGSTDMKGPLSVAIVAARALPREIPITLLISADEETTKAGAREIALRSTLAKSVKPSAIAILEPTRMLPMRGHRVHVQFTVVATGIQAHSSTGRGRNANWDLLPFLMEMRAIHERLRKDTTLQDPAYDPPFSDFNLVIDNHGTATNVTVPKASAGIKFRYSAKVDPRPIVELVREAAHRHGLALNEGREGDPPELPEDHPFVRLCSELVGAPPGVAPYGTDASELQTLAPCVIIGPGDIAHAHRPNESVAIAELAAAVPILMQLAKKCATHKF